MMKIVTIPNTVLTTPTKPVTAIDARIKKLVVEMEKTLMAQTDPEGVGLAATQVGMNLSLFIVKNNPQEKTRVFINPKIISTEELPASPLATRGRMEGCLSIPRIWAPLARARRVTVEYQDLEGALHTRTFTGLQSTIVLHEVDHLNGVLFTQRCLENNIPLYEERGDSLELMKTI
jgi:peptide deformylase